MSAEQAAELPIYAWSVTAKGGQFQRGLYHTKREEWMLDGDTQRALCDHATATAKIAALRAELEKAREDAEMWRKEAKLNELRVITCGVAATHPDASLTLTGAYACKWDTQQAGQVRALRERADRACAATSTDQVERKV